MFLLILAARDHIICMHLHHGEDRGTTPLQQAPCTSPSKTPQRGNLRAAGWKKSQLYDHVTLLIKKKHSIKSIFISATPLSQKKV